MRKRREKQERENGRACGSRQVLAGAYAPDSGIRECRGGRAWAHAAGSASGAASRVVTTGCGSVYRRRTRRRSAGGRVEAADLRLPKSMILIAFGTRPEAIKLGPVAAELAADKVPFGLLAAGQHRELLVGTPAETDLAAASSLGLPSEGNVVRWLARARARVRVWLREHEEFDPVVVQGDTMSALAVARAACDAGRAVAHIEAGVRSHDRANPWPEEQTRVEITELARWHYAATPTAWANLAQEGVPSSLIVLTGNPIVSALARYTAARPCGPQPHILVTLHRREWLLGDCVA